MPSSEATRSRASSKLRPKRGEVGLQRVGEVGRTIADGALGPVLRLLAAELEDLTVALRLADVLSLGVGVKKSEEWNVELVEDGDRDDQIRLRVAGGHGDAVGVEAALGVGDSFDQGCVGVSLAEEDCAGEDRLAEAVGEGFLDVGGRLLAVVDRLDRRGDRHRVGSNAGCAAVGEAAAESEVGKEHRSGEVGNLLGNSGADTLAGNGAKDVLVGDLGAGGSVGGVDLDRLDLKKSTLLAATGDDRAYGGPGDDFVRGDSGDDSVYGTADDVASWATATTSSTAARARTGSSARPTTTRSSAATATTC